MQNSIQSFSIELPWPQRVLFPNARPHWAVKSKKVKVHRNWARIVTMNEVKAPIHPKGRIGYTIDFTPPINRKRDEDGILSACKSYLDGVADALGVNDTLFTIKGMQGHPAQAPGAIKLTFSWEENRNAEDCNG